MSGGGDPHGREEAGGPGRPAEEVVGARAAVLNLGSRPLAATRHARSRVTEPIVVLIRQGHSIMAGMPPMAAQADAAAHTRQAAVEYEEATRRWTRP